MFFIEVWGVSGLFGLHSNAAIRTPQ